MKQKILFTLFISFSYIFVYSQTNIYASPNGPNTNDGLSVGTAVNLQKAKDIANTVLSNPTNINKADATRNEMLKNLQ